jgi:hypothetical protein
MTSFRDPAYRNQAFDHVLVHANIRDLEWRSAIESQLVYSLRMRGVRATRSMSVLYPTRTYSDSAALAVVESNGIDGYLLVTIGDLGEEAVHIPITGPATTTEGTAYQIGNGAQYREVTRTTPGTAVHGSKPWAYFTSEVYDTRSGDKAWIATSMTSGDVFSTLRTVVDSYCNEVAKQMTFEGVVKTMEPQQQEPLETSSFTIVLEDGRRVGASRITPSSIGYLRVESTSGPPQYIADAKIRSILDASGRDWTKQVLVRRKALP